MNISTLLYGRGAPKESLKIAPKLLVDEVQRSLLEDQVHIRVFEHSPIGQEQFREIHISSPKLETMRDPFGGYYHRTVPPFRVINGNCSVEEIGFGPRDNTSTLRILRERIAEIAKVKAKSLLSSLEYNCRSAIDNNHKAPPPILESVMCDYPRLTIVNQYAAPRLGFREELPLLVLDNDHAKRIGMQGFKGIYSSRRDRFVISDGTFYLIGQGDNFSTKSIVIGMLQPRLSVARLFLDTWGEPLVILERSYGEIAMKIGFHLKETCRAQLLSVSNKLI